MYFKEPPCSDQKYISGCLKVQGLEELPEMISVHNLWEDDKHASHYYTL